ncbi:MAG: choice-of-anchor J domain-containing protein [Duncaniella sp.]|nr:choice-of-anchor J domain-containing protein [Duncaniella sp.]
MNNILKSVFAIAALGTGLFQVWGAGPAELRKAPDALTPPEPATMLCGIMVSNDDWTSTDDAGVYTIEVKPDGEVKCIYKSADMANTAAALLHNNIMYTVTASLSGCYYNQYSSTDWKRTSHQAIDEINVPSDLTYDPVSGKTIGGFWDSDYGGYSIVASFGLGDAEHKALTGYWDERDFFAFAATPEGTVYSLYGSFNYLVKVNVNNRNASTPIVERIKSTGLNPEYNMIAGKVGSMTYDEANKRLLAIIPQEDGWGENKKNWTSLVEINPETGVATEIRQMPGNACFAGIYVMEAVTDPMAPASATGLAVVPNVVDPLSATVSFSIPAVTFGGAPLTGQVMAIVEVNGAVSVHGYYNAGDKVEIPIALTEGDNTVKVTLATDTLRGEPVEKTIFAGEDAPLDVTNVRVNIEGGIAKIDWEAPAGGANGGSIIPANITYVVTRMPDNKVIAEGIAATSVTDNDLPATARSIYYTVKARNSKGESNAVESNRVPASGAFGIPFTETFDSADDFALWTVIDPNGGPTWSYNDGQADYLNNPGLVAGDDWLISPAINLEAGKSYKLRYEYRTGGYQKAESFEIKAGTSLLPEAMTVEVAAHNGVTNTKYTAAEVSFKASETGKWYIGIHYTGPAENYRLMIDNVTLTEFDGRVPATVSDLSVSPKNPGSLDVSVAFTVPTLDADGNELASVSKAELYREDISATTPVKVFDGIAPGETLSYDDTVDKAGKYTYIAKVYNANECGVAASVTAFIGEDRPAAPSSLIVTEDGEHPVVSWVAPATGDNGGWIDPSKLSYLVYRNGVKVAEDVKETTFTDVAYKTPSDRQDAITYIVISCYSGVSSRGAQTDATVVGAPYKAPVNETFPEAGMNYYPWLTQSFMSPTNAWTLETSGISPVVADHSGDRGVACFHAVGEQKGVVSYYYSPKFDISELDSPVLSFYMYHTPSVEGDGFMQVLLSTGGGEFTETGKPFARTDAEADGWVRHIIDLSSHKGSKDLRVGFAGTGDGAANIFIDDIQIMNILQRDAAIASFKAPIRVAAGQKFVVEAAIENIGLEDLSGLSLTVYDGSEPVASKTDIEVAANSNVEMEFEMEFATPGVRTLKAVIADDAGEDNNIAESQVNVVTPVLPAVTDLKATVADGKVTLSWQSPEERGAVTDDVESYTDWAIAGIGEWTMHDGDYSPTVYINKDLGQYPNATDRKAFQVCNASTLGIDIWDEGKPHSGNKMFMAVASVGYVNNDWLISPRLNGARQWVSFYARSFTLQNIAPERMRVWYSTSDTDPVNFVELTTNPIELGGTWLEYRFMLPEGARYFAINCVSDDSFAMFVDDITFNDMSVPDWTLTGYEVMHNGETVATVTEPEFSHISAGGKYTVRPVFEQGVGEYCEPIEVATSALSELSSQVSVEAVDGAIVVNGYSGHVIVTNVIGQTFIADAGTINVAPGVYLVTVESKTVKIIVK